MWLVTRYRYSMHTLAIVPPPLFVLDVPWYKTATCSQRTLCTCLYHGRVFSLLPWKTSRTWMVLAVAVSPSPWIPVLAPGPGLVNSECSHPERYVSRISVFVTRTAETFRRQGVSATRNEIDHWARNIQQYPKLSIWAGSVLYLADLRHTVDLKHIIGVLN